MVNKFARGVPVEPYHPHGLLPEGLLPVSRPDGSFETEMANAAGRVAGTFNAIADEAAKAEGAAGGKVAGLEPHYRPDGSLTIRGQAFNEAATKTYSNNLDASLRTDLQSAFEANKNDPKKLKNTFDALAGEYRDKHVFPEIMGDFNAQFARLRLPYENKALANFEEGVKDESRASTVNLISATQTNAARMAAADPNNPETARAIAADLSRLDRKLDADVESEALPAASAAKLKISTRDTVLSSAALAQAATLKTPEEIAAYRENAKTKFAKGEFKGLSADGYSTLDASLQALEKSTRTTINAGVTQLSKNIDDYVDRAASGLPLPPDEWTRYVTSEAAKTPKGALAVATGENKVKLATVMSNLSVEDAGRLVAGLRAEASKGGATAPAGDLIDFAEKQLEKQRKALNTDQLGYAAQKRLIPQISPIDLQGFAASNDPAAAGVLAAQIRDRTAQARAVGGSLSRAPQFLRPEETDRLKEIVDRGGPQALALAGAIVKGADADAPTILKEISKDAPVLAQSGIIIANGGSLSAARDAFEFNRLKAEKLDPLTVADAAQTTANLATIGTALARVPDAAGNIRVTANAIAGARITRAGLDPKSSEAETVYKRSLQEAAGATFVGGTQYGGLGSYSTGWFGKSGQTVIPPGIRADALRDVMRAVTDDDLKSLPVPPQTADDKPYSTRDLARAFPVAVPGGYRLALGDPASDTPQFMRGADGKPFVLPFDALIKIAPRVPGALLGGE